MEYGLLEGLIILVLKFFSSLIDLLPTFSFSNGSSIESSIKFVADLINGSSILLPVSDIFIIIGLIVSFRSLMFLVFITNWIIRRIADVIP